MPIAMCAARRPGRSGLRRMKGAVEPLVKALRDADASVRMRAAMALGRIGDPRAVKPLFEALTETDVFARFTMIQALRRMHHWQLAPEYIKSPYKAIREATVLALTGIYDDGAVQALADAIATSDDPEIQARAVEAIGEVHHKADPYTGGWWGTQAAAGKPKPIENPSLVGHADRDRRAARGAASTARGRAQGGGRGIGRCARPGCAARAAEDCSPPIRAMPCVWKPCMCWAALHDHRPRPLLLALAADASRERSAAASGDPRDRHDRLAGGRRAACADRWPTTRHHRRWSSWRLETLAELKSPAALRRRRASAR